MKSFDQWTRDIARSIDDTTDYVTNDISDYVTDTLEDGGVRDPDAEGGWLYPCIRCEQLAPIICDPDEFDPSMHYCGKDQYCCP